MHITYAAPRLDDLPLLLELVAEYYAYDHHPFAADDIATTLSALIQHPDWGRLWLIQSDEHAIGYVILAFGFSLESRGRDALVDEIYLRPAYRRQGIGTRTFQFLEHQCRQWRIRALYLQVERHNPQAQRLYHRLGYHLEHDRPMLVKRLPST